MEPLASARLAGYYFTRILDLNSHAPERPELLSPSYRRVMSRCWACRRRGQEPHFPAPPIQRWLVRRPPCASEA